MASPIKQLHVFAELENGDCRLVAMDFVHQMFLQDLIEKHVGGKIKLRRDKLPIRASRPAESK